MLDIELIDKLLQGSLSTLAVPEIRQIDAACEILDCLPAENAKGIFKSMVLTQLGCRIYNLKLRLTYLILNYFPHEPET